MRMTDSFERMMRMVLLNFRLCPRSGLMISMPDSCQHGMTYLCHKEALDWSNHGMVQADNFRRAIAR